MLGAKSLDKQRRSDRQGKHSNRQTLSPGEFAEDARPAGVAPVPGQGNAPCACWPAWCEAAAPGARSPDRTRTGTKAAPRSPQEGPPTWPSTVYSQKTRDHLAQPPPPAKEPRPAPAGLPGRLLDGEVSGTCPPAGLPACRLGEVSGTSCTQAVLQGQSWAADAHGQERPELGRRVVWPSPAAGLPPCRLGEVSGTSCTQLCFSTAGQCSGTDCLTSPADTGRL